MWRELSPILVPLPFAIIIFLFALLANARGINNVAPVPLAIILLVVVVIQGTCLFYAGDAETPWILSIAGGYLLFLLILAYVFFGFGGSLLLLVLLALLAIIFGRRIIRPVPPGVVDVVLMPRGRSRTLRPGVNMLFPWEKFYTRLSTKKITWSTPPIRVTMTRDQDVELVADVTYQLDEDDANIAALQTADWEGDLHRHILSTIKNVANELSPADFVAWAHHIHSHPQATEVMTDPTYATHWDRLNAAILRRLQDEMAESGVLVSLVQMQDITVIPHLASTAAQSSMAARTLDRGAVRGQSPAFPSAVPPAAPMPIQAADLPTVTTRQAEIAAQPTAPPAQVMLAQSAAVPAGPAGGTPPLPPVPSRSAFDTMIASFNSVRDEQITDPEFILDLAARFQAIANNPEADAQFPYDAEKAAETLIKRARYILAAQEHQRASLSASAPPAPAPTPAHVERRARRLPTLPNDNLAQGG